MARNAHSLEAQLSRKEQFAERMHVLARVGRFSLGQFQQLLNQLERDDEEAAEYLRFLTLRNPPLFYDNGSRFTPERAEKKQPWLRKSRAKRGCCLNSQKGFEAS